jgi:hypothetical protein
MPSQVPRYTARAQNTQKTRLGLLRLVTLVYWPIRVLSGFSALLPLARPCQLPCVNRQIKLHEPRFSRASPS